MDIEISRENGNREEIDGVFGHIVSVVATISIRRGEN
jgi:hypothetical protein